MRTDQEKKEWSDVRSHHGLLALRIITRSSEQKKKDTKA